MFKTGDIIQPVGMDYLGDMKQKYYVVDSDGYFYDEHERRWTPYHESDRYWGAKLIAPAKDVVKVLDLDIADNFHWWMAHKNQIVQRAEAEVRRHIQFNMRAWPYEKELYHTISQYDKKIYFFFASPPESPE